MLGDINTNSVAAITSSEGETSYIDSNGNKVAKPENTYEIVSAPEYGKRVGPFTEISPLSIPSSAKLECSPYEAKIQCNSQMKVQDLSFVPGNTIALELTNHSSVDQTVIAYRRPSGSYSYRENFNPVEIKAGETLTRAFTMDENADELQQIFTWGMGGDGATNISVKITEYVGNFGK